MLASEELQRMYTQLCVLPAAVLSWQLLDPYLSRSVCLVSVSVLLEQVGRYTQAVGISLAVIRFDDHESLNLGMNMRATVKHTAFRFTLWCIGPSWRSPVKLEDLS